MIEENMIEFIFEYIEEEKKDLSEYQKEYLLTLLMNLSLNPRGREVFQKDTGLKFIKILLRMLENCSFSQRHFINGIIYTLLKSEQIKTNIKELEIEKLIMKNFDGLEDRFQRQLIYIKERLNSENPNEENDEKEELEDIDNLNVKDILNLEKPLNKKELSLILQHYEIKDQKKSDSMLKLIKSYFNLFFKESNEKVKFDVSFTEKPLQRPSTPSYFTTKLSDDLEQSELMNSKSNHLEDNNSKSLQLESNNNETKVKSQFYEKDKNFSSDSEEKNQFK